ncbi:hypothetical protein [Bradyrhizobium canariense]|uniref:hypothetical protein n=1 Tax=Bradyrhizobium canariense TaxID=255045 RepID=UPI001CA5753E|nr:hypothetical protein [Bradyrhizobium canariense]
MLHRVRVRGADGSGCPARPRRAAAKPMRRTGASVGGKSPRQSSAAVRRCPSAGPRRTCGNVRGVCPILVLVNRLQKEHLA